MSDEWPFNQARTDELTEALRKRQEARWTKQFATPIPVWTCTNCEARNRCALAFDSYNTAGDCLAAK